LDLLGRLQRKLYNYGRLVFLNIFLRLILYLIDTILRLHAGVSTLEAETRHAIPFSAFVDAVEEYQADSATDDEGSMRIA
jgi:hypothetical protein